jgi:nucleotide-binding universal stress UspA family protein
MKSESACPVLEPKAAVGFKPRNILVPFSSLESSEGVFGCARWFAEQAGVKINVLFAPGSAGFDMTPQDLQAEITRLSGINRDSFGAILMVPAGDRMEQITNATRAEATDLIILPANFFKNTSQLFHAHPLATVIRQATCPVLIVPEKSLPHKFI